MAQAEHFDALILGAGPAGILLSSHLGRSGKRVAVVERRYIGGSCPNIACMPSKNVIWGARIGYLARNAAQFGTITGPVTIDMAKVRQRKRDMVEREIAAHRAPVVSSGGELIKLPSDEQGQLMKTFSSVGADVSKTKPALAAAYQVVADAAQRTR